MKRIEDIEKLSIEELEAASETLPVPEGFRQRIESTLLSEESLAAEGVRGRKTVRLAVRSVVSMLAVAAVVAAVLLIRKPAELKDSFDDPMLAYAQVEQTFQYISGKMSGGIDMVRDAAPIAVRPEEIIKKINSK